MGRIGPIVRIGNPGLGLLYLVRYLDAHLGPVGPYFRSIWVQVVPNRLRSTWFFGWSLHYWILAPEVLAGKFCHQVAGLPASVVLSVMASSRAPQFCCFWNDLNLGI